MNKNIMLGILILTDKFGNFREYYWLPNGPYEIPVKGQSKNIVSTYRVEVLEEDNEISLLFIPDGLTKIQI